MRRMRRIGLVLVDEGGRGVDGPDVVGGVPMIDHHAPGPATVARVSTMKLVGLPGIVERIVGHQRDHHGAAAALADEVETVIEELAEQREPGVERRRQALVGRDVGDDDVGAVELDAVGVEQRQSSGPSTASSAVCAAATACCAAAAQPAAPRCGAGRGCRRCVRHRRAGRPPSVSNSGRSGA